MSDFNMNHPTNPTAISHPILMTPKSLSSPSTPYDSPSSTHPSLSFPSPSAEISGTIPLNINSKNSHRSHALPFSFSTPSPVSISHTKSVPANGPIMSERQQMAMIKKLLMENDKNNNLSSSLSSPLVIPIENEMNSNKKRKVIPSSPSPSTAASHSSHTSYPSASPSQRKVTDRENQRDDDDSDNDSSSSSSSSPTPSPSPSISSPFPLSFPSRKIPLNFLTPKTIRIPSDFSLWPNEKQKKWRGMKKNPNDFYYFHTPPGVPMTSNISWEKGKGKGTGKEQGTAAGSADWSDMERRRFLRLLIDYPPVDYQWGLFSLLLHGRNGQQCEAFCQQMIKKGFVTKLKEISHEPIDDNDDDMDPLPFYLTQKGKDEAKKFDEMNYKHSAVDSLSVPTTTPLWSLIFRCSSVASVTSRGISTDLVSQRKKEKLAEREREKEFEREREGKRKDPLQQRRKGKEMDMDLDIGGDEEQDGEGESEWNHENDNDDESENEMEFSPTTPYSSSPSDVILSFSSGGPTATSSPSVSDDKSDNSKGKRKREKEKEKVMDKDKEKERERERTLRHLEGNEYHKGNDHQHHQQTEISNDTQSHGDSERAENVLLSLSSSHNLKRDENRNSMSDFPSNPTSSPSLSSSSSLSFKWFALQGENSHEQFIEKVEQYLGLENGENTANDNGHHQQDDTHDIPMNINLTMNANVPMIFGFPLKSSPSPITNSSKSNSPYDLHLQRLQSQYHLEMERESMKRKGKGKGQNHSTPFALPPSPSLSLPPSSLSHYEEIRHDLWSENELNVLVETQMIAMRNQRRREKEEREKLCSSRKSC